MKKYCTRPLLFLLSLVVTGLSLLASKPESLLPWINDNFQLAAAKTKAMAEASGDSSRIPVTMKTAGKPHLANLYDWRSGFFAGIPFTAVLIAGAGNRNFGEVFCFNRFFQFFNGFSLCRPVIEP
jgi:hypothetical protein